MRSRRTLLAAATMLCPFLAPAPAVHAQGAGLPFGIPAELLRPISFSWTGSLDGAAKALADRIGYGFASGDALGAPVPAGLPSIEVSINVVNTPAADVAQLLGNFVRGRAVVVVNPETRKIEVYRHG